MRHTGEAIGARSLDGLGSPTRLLLLLLLLGACRIRLGERILATSAEITTALQRTTPAAKRLMWRDFGANQKRIYLLVSRITVEGLSSIAQAHSTFHNSTLPKGYRIRLGLPRYLNIIYRTDLICAQIDG